MKDELFVIGVEEIKNRLAISESCAYRLVRQLNSELRAMGYITVKGKVNRSYFYQKFGIKEEAR